jgi:glucose/arabinose dehydrogenase
MKLLRRTLVYSVLLLALVTAVACTEAEGPPQTPQPAEAVTPEGIEVTPSPTPEAEEVSETPTLTAEPEETDGATPATEAAETPDATETPEAASEPVVGVESIVTGLTAPLVLTSPDDDSGRLFIADQDGVIWILTEEGERLDTPYLDLSDRLVQLNPGYDERGLLGLAFHPDYAENGRFFVYYSAPLREGGPGGWDHTSHLSEFTVSSDSPDQADPESERIIMEVDQPQSNHNGGQLAFGPDGYLYIALGDGGSAHDVGLGHTAEIGNGQDITNLLGSILRIDVDGDDPYGIPEDNPFVGTEGRDEIFAYGLRNPYRMSFDSAEDQQLFTGDVGQGLWEEVNIVTLGGNYGWPIKEGTHCFSPDSPRNPPDTCPDTGPRGEELIDPILEYQNANVAGGLGRAVIGGYVYRGSELPGFEGRYVFGDWSLSFGQPLGTLFVATPPDDGGDEWPFEELEVAERPDGRLGEYVLALGRDATGELYVLTHETGGPQGSTGKVLRLTAPE